MSRAFRRTLVRQLEGDGLIRSPPVRAAFLKVPRELFVPEFARRQGLAAVYRDEAILTRQNRFGAPLSSSSQPAIMAAMLEALQLEEGMSVLEIGAGTGYNAALLSQLVGKHGRVVSVEVDPAIAQEARRNMRTGGFEARVVVADGRQGVAQLAPFDRIIATASSRLVPFSWFEQLEPHGLLEAPLQLAGGAQAIPLLRKTRTGFRSTTTIAGGFMPLRDAGEDAAAALTLPSLVATDSTTGMAMHQLVGEAVRTLSARAKRQLLSISLGDGRSRPLGLRANASALGLFVSLTLPAQRLVATVPLFEIGAITRDGQSLALIRRSPARNGTVATMSVFGSDAAAELLLERVREWDRRGRPSESSLAVTVRYDKRRNSRVTCRWPPASRGQRSTSRGARRRGA